MKNDFEDWALDWGNNSISTTDVHSGEKSLRIEGDGGRARELITGFTVGSSYTLSAWGKLSENKASPSYTVGAIFLDGDGSRIGVVEAPSFTSTIYELQSVEFIVPEGTEKIQIYAYFNTLQELYFYVDDFYLAANSTPVDKTALINALTAANATYTAAVEGIYDTAKKQ